MDKTFVMFIEKTKIYNRINKEIVTSHVNNLKDLDMSGYMNLCGVFKGYPGMAGMVIINAKSYEEAEEICKRDPLVTGGYATYKLVELQLANKENNYLL